MMLSLGQGLPDDTSKDITLNRLRQVVLQSGNLWSGMNIFETGPKDSSEAIIPSSDGRI